MNAGGRPRRFTNAQIEAALIEAGGLVTHAAKILNCEPITVDRYVKKSEQLQTTLKWEREKLVDLAESKFRGHLEQGNLTAVQFALSTLGKNRGYVGKSEVDVSSTQGVTVNVQGVPSANRDGK